MEEVTKAIKQMKNGKAAGVDGIPPEILKNEGPVLPDKLHGLLSVAGSRANYHKTSAMQP